MAENDKVRILPGLGKRDPNALLQCMQNAELESVTIMGWDAAGYFAYSTSHAQDRDVLWDLEQLKRIIVE